jgi:hypothetical protein
MLDERNELDLPALIHAIARPIFCWAQKTELTFPIAEDVRLESGQLAHIADRKEFLDWL